MHIFLQKYAKDEGNDFAWKYAGWRLNGPKESFFDVQPLITVEK